MRAESRLRNPWVIAKIGATFPDRKPDCIHVLDVGCGGGFLSNPLAAAGFTVFGIDAAKDALEVADRRDETKSINYILGDAYNLPFSDGCFEAVCAMDFLEHIDNPDRIVEEVARVLVPGGLFFYYTFNRNWLANFIVIKGVEWFVKNTPKDLHVINLFVKPEEMDVFCGKYGLQVVELRGMRPKIFNQPFFQLLTKGTVNNDFEFQFTESTMISYLGVAKK